MPLYRPFGDSGVPLYECVSRSLSTGNYARGDTPRCRCMRTGSRGESILGTVGRFWSRCRVRQVGAEYGEPVTDTAASRTPLGAAVSANEVGGTGSRRVTFDREHTGVLLYGFTSSDRAY